MVVQGLIKIASLPLIKQYKPEDISFDVDGENIILHGQHRSEGKDGFENNEFKKIIKLPDGVYPATVKSRVIKNLKSNCTTATKRICPALRFHKPLQIMLGKIHKKAYCIKYHIGSSPLCPITNRRHKLLSTRTLMHYIISI